MKHCLFLIIALLALSACNGKTGTATATVQTGDTIDSNARHSL